MTICGWLYPDGESHDDVFRPGTLEISRLVNYFTVICIALMKLGTEVSGISRSGRFRRKNFKVEAIA